MFKLTLFDISRPFPEGQDNILPQTLATHIPLKKPNPHTIPPGLAKLSEATGYSR